MISSANNWRGIHAARVEAQEDEPATDRLDVKEKERRGEQWRRTMFVAELLMGAPRGLPLDEITARVNEWLGLEYSDRTIRRDLDLLISMGLVERVRDRQVITLRWAAHQHSLSRMVLSCVSLRNADDPARRPCEAVDHRSDRHPHLSTIEATLRKLPPPWELDQKMLRATTSAVRLLAMVETGSSSYADAVLVYQLNRGWQLRRPGADAPSRKTVMSAITLAEELDRAEDARWELAEDAGWESDQ